MSLSVVIPTYNRADLLPATLDSVFAQTVAPDEVIVVDDGSQDDTPAVLRRYAGRVRNITIENSGDLVARNAGLAAASGELVAFCDSDDIWRPGHLAAMAELWRREPATRCAYGDFVILRDGVWGATSKFAGVPRDFWRGLRIHGRTLGWFDRPIIDRLVTFQPFFPSCMVADRRFLLSVGGWDDQVPRLGGDVATALLMAEHPPLGVYRGPAQVGIRKHGANLSGDDQALNLGASRMFELVLATRPSVAGYADLIREKILALRVAALDTAFARHDFQAVQEIDALLGPARKPAPLRVKRWVASLPEPLRVPLAAALLAAGSAKAGLLRI